MHGVILAGGLGTRMGMYTKRIGNKHLMPIYDRLMIEFPISTLVKSGVKNITIVTGNRYSGQFVDLLGNGKEWGLDSINYAYQFGEGGIADALRCAYNSVPKDEPIMVILGDNLFSESFASIPQDDKNAQVFLKFVHDPERFGVAELRGTSITRIVEKPKNPVGNMAVTGLYIYPYDVFSKISSLSPSDRGELEVTDLNNMYLAEGRLEWWEVTGKWHDAGTPDSLLECSKLVKEGVFKI